MESHLAGSALSSTQVTTANGPNLPARPPSNMGDTVQVMRLDVESRVEPEQHRERYLFLDHFFA